MFIRGNTSKLMQALKDINQGLLTHHDELESLFRSISPFEKTKEND